ncbi:MAG: acetyl-CoA carboxylase biotin carboxyl carrier protein [Bilifractor sp.]
MSYTVDELQKLMTGFQKSGLSRFRYTTQDGTLELRNEAVRKAFVPDQVTVSQSSVPVPDSAADLDQSTKRAEQTVSMMRDKGNQKEPAEGKTRSSEAEKLVQIRTPLAGIFYRASKPGEKPYVEEGQQVKKGDVVGLVEAMKMMNEITAPCDGVICEIRAGDAGFAAYDAVLMTMEEI